MTKHLLRVGSAFRVSVPRRKQTMYNPRQYRRRNEAQKVEAHIRKRSSTWRLPCDECTPLSLPTGTAHLLEHLWDSKFQSHYHYRQGDLRPHILFHEGLRSPRLQTHLQGLRITEILTGPEHE